MATLPQSSRPEYGDFPNLLPEISPGHTPLPTVQLLHRLPDESEHVDWMIARDGGGETSLVSFRLPHSLDTLPPPPQGMIAQWIGDHRPAYLNYEGPVSRGRGVVSRLARGRVVRARFIPTPSEMNHWELEILWERAGGSKKKMILSLKLLKESDGLVQITRLK